MNLSARPGERPWHLHAMALTSGLFVFVGRYRAYRREDSGFSVPGGLDPVCFSSGIASAVIRPLSRGCRPNYAPPAAKSFASLLMLGMPPMLHRFYQENAREGSNGDFLGCSTDGSRRSFRAFCTGNGPAPVPCWRPCPPPQARCWFQDLPYVSLPRGSPRSLPVGMAACFAGYLLTLRALAGEPIIPKLVHTALWVFLPLTLALPLFWKMPSSTDLIAMSSIGVIGCAALFLLDRALEMAPPMIIAPAVCTQPVWAEILEGRRPTPLTLLGLVFILSAIAAVALWRPAGVPRGAAAAAGTGA